MDKYTFCFASLQQSQTEQDVENKYFDNYSDMLEYATNRLPDESDGVWVVDVNNDENKKRSYFITNDLDEIKRYISSATPATKMTIFEWEDYETCGQSMCDLAEGLTDNVWDLKNSKAIIPPDLDAKGFGVLKEGRELEDWDFDLIQKVRKYVDENYEMTKHINKKIGSSYALKHLAEAAIGEYVSNGYLIAAFISEGHKYLIRNDGLNCWFNAVKKITL